MMLDNRILIKSLNDIDVKLMLCKTNFEWELLAKKFQEVSEEVDKFFKGQEIPEKIQTALDAVRASLVNKKGLLPPVELSEFFK